MRNLFQSYISLIQAVPSNTAFIFFISFQSYISLIQAQVLKNLMELLGFQSYISLIQANH